MNKQELEAMDDQAIGTWNSHDEQAWAGMFADDAVITQWTDPQPANGKDGAAAMFRAWIGAFPDMSIEVVKRVVGDDSVAAEVRFSGTNTGAMNMGGMEMPPTNKSAMGRGAYIARVRDGKISEFHAFPDAAGIMMQLGLMPAM
jgi:predicted ester cyclase